MGQIQNDAAQSPLGSDLLRQKVGKKTQIIRAMKGSSSYATGGDTLTAAQMGLGAIGSIINVQPCLDNSNTYRITPLFATTGPVSTLKLIFHKVSDGTEPANATDLSAIKFRLEVLG